MTYLTAIIGYKDMDLSGICQAINSFIGKQDPYEGIAFVPAIAMDREDVAGSSCFTADDWQDDHIETDGTLRLTFYANAMDPLSDLWIVHLHKATGHVKAMKVQGETEPSLTMETVSIIVPSLAIASLRNI